MPFLVYCWSSCSFTFFTSFYILLDIMTQYTNTVSSFLFYFILYRQIECYRRTTNKKGGTHRVDIQSAPQVAQKGGEKKVIMQPILYPKEKSETTPSHLPSPEGNFWGSCHWMPILTALHFQRSFYSSSSKKTKIIMKEPVPTFICISFPQIYLATWAIAHRQL